MKFFNKYFFTGLGIGTALGIILVIGGFAIFGFIMMRSMSDMGKMEEFLSPPPLPIDQLAEYDWTVQSLNGQNFDMAVFTDQPVFINFWATWCMLCRAEMPSIQRLYDQLKGEGILFACISQEGAEKIEAFVKEEGYTFPIYTMSTDRPEVFETAGIPTTFILSPDGRIAFKHVGSAKWDDPSVIDFIRQLKEDLQPESE